MIYLDNAATTKTNKEILQDYSNLLDKYFINADSPYLPAIKINSLQEKARGLLAELMKVKNDELIFMASGSEANNSAIKGIAYKYLERKQKHIITSLIEHSSVYETMKLLEKQGFEITYLKPNQYGVIANEDVINNLREDTILISLMKINSEIGAINNVEAIYDQIKKTNPQTIVHCDCVQAFGKYDLDLTKMDLASFSAHKINGLKGSGLLYKKSNVTIVPLISGGQQEFHLRAGTSNYATNVMLAKTLRLFLEKRNITNIKELYDYAYQLLSKDERIKINSHPSNNSYYVINFSIPDYQPETILNDLEKQEIYFSTKSACSTNVKRSRVIDALAIDEKLKDSSFRISFSLDSTKEEIDCFYQALNKCLNTLTKG